MRKQLWEFRPGGCTHKVFPEELFPVLFFSFGCDQRPISLEHPLRLDVPIMGSFKHVQPLKRWTI